MNEGSVDLRGVRTWYGEVGQGPPLVMLHPGGVDSRVFAPNVAALAPHFHVWLLERRGHGRTPDADGPYTRRGPTTRFKVRTFAPIRRVAAKD